MCTTCSIHTCKSTTKEHKSTHALFLFASRGHDSKQAHDASCQHSFPFSLIKIKTNTNSKVKIKINVKTRQTRADTKTNTDTHTKTITNADEKATCLKHS